MIGVASEPEIQKGLSSYLNYNRAKNSSITFYVKEDAEYIWFK